MQDNKTTCRGSQNMKRTQNQHVEENKTRCKGQQNNTEDSKTCRGQQNDNYRTTQHIEDNNTQDNNTAHRGQHISTIAIG